MLLIIEVEEPKKQKIGFRTSNTSGEFVEAFFRLTPLFSRLFLCFVFSATTLTIQL